MGVELLEKVRVYELAKELNTTSKRLMEKLAEINIIVKNHMSLLDSDELNALYDHIGVIRRDDTNKPEGNKNAESAVAPNVDRKKEEKKDRRDIPTIIRKTEIIIDTKAENSDSKSSSKQNKPKKNGKNDRKNTGNGWEVIRASDASSGLRAGFVRHTKADLQRELLKAAAENNAAVENAKEITRKNEKTDVKPTVKEEVKPASKEEIKPLTKEEAKPASKEEIKPLAKEEVKPAAKEEVKPQAKEEVKPAAKEEVKPQAKEEVKTKEEVKLEVKTTVKAETKPEAKAEIKPESKPEVREQMRAAEKNETSIEIKDDKKTIDKENQAALKENVVTETVNKDIDLKADKKAEDNKAEEKRAEDIKAEEKKAEDRKVEEKKAEDKKDGPEIARHDRTQNGKHHENKEAVARNEQHMQSGKGRPHKDQQKFGGHAVDKTEAGSGSKKSGANRKKIEIPLPEIPVAKVEINDSPKKESKRESINRDIDKEARREQKKETPKVSNMGRVRKLRPHDIALHEKKGISEILSEDFILDDIYDDGNKRAWKAAKPKKDSKNAKNAKVEKAKPVKAVLTSIKIPESITVKELAEALKKTATEVIKKLMSMGVLATLNQEIDFDTAAIIADEFGVKAEKEVVISEEDILFDESDEGENMQPRPPVVVVMGHVDHGKTSLLDAIRQTNVTEKEAGGITQHIGAYMVNVDGRKVTFLDTPGHEAFTAMRARGAQVTDIAVLVVAADDGVMPQTVEAINHAKAANVAIIVAINKIDKPGANPDRVKQELTEYNLVPEEWGGDVICVPVSAKNRINIDQLLEMILLTADMLELKADPDKQPKGTIIEAKLDKNRGPVATLLVQRGTLKVGDSIVTGTTVGRIRAMSDDKGRNIKKAGPSTPVEIIGLPEVPEAGEIFYAIKDEKVAKHLAEKRKAQQRDQMLKARTRVSLDDLFNQIQEGKVKELNVIVKADVQGSVEAVRQSLEKLSNNEVRVKTIHGAVGAITESDVNLAQVSDAIIIGFNVRPGPNVTDIANNAGVDIRLYRVIYDAIEDVQAAMKGMLEPEFKEKILGHTEVRQIFKASGVGTIGGCYVLDGKITRNSEIRVVRDGIVVHEGKLASLKRFKDDVKEVLQGFECGISIEKYNDIKVGDIIESYIMEKVER